MAAAVVCRKRSFFEDTESPLHITKKLCRFSTPSSVRFSPPRPLSPTLLDRLIVSFPDMDRELLEKAVKECGSRDLDSAIKKLHELRLGSQPTTPKDASTTSNLPMDGAGWVELLVQEMMKATSVDDARSRAAKFLESLETSISSRVRAEATKDIEKEKSSMKEQLDVMVKENGVLKRAVTIQHERQKEYSVRNQEVQQLKQLVAQYQEQVRSLEGKNYAMGMYLQRQTQDHHEFNTINPNRDVF